MMTYMVWRLGARKKNSARPAFSRFRVLVTSVSSVTFASLLVFMFVSACRLSLVACLATLWFDPFRVPVLSHCILLFW